VFLGRSCLMQNPHNLGHGHYVQYSNFHQDLLYLPTCVASVPAALAPYITTGVPGVHSNHAPTLLISILDPPASVMFYPMPHVSM
jgi:hypothetical protein